LNLFDIASAINAAIGFDVKGKVCRVPLFPPAGLCVSGNVANRLPPQRKNGLGKGSRYRASRP